MICFMEEKLNWEKMKWLNDNCKFGKFTSGDGRFVGKEIKCRADGSFVASQPLFAQKIELVPLDKEGKKER